MNVQLTSLLSDAKRITKITQNYYQTRNDFKQDKTKITFSKEVDLLKQKLFSIQSAISEHQTFKEGLKEIHKELVNLESQYNTTNLELFYQNVYNISKKYSYNQENLISREFLTSFYEKNVNEDQISGFLNQTNQSISHIQDKIDHEKLTLLKLQISSENMVALSAADNSLFNAVKRDLDQTSSLIMKKVHTLESNEQVGHLLT